MNEKQFVISGKARRTLKKQVSLKKYTLGMSHYWNDVDTVYGGGLSPEDLIRSNEELRNEIRVIEIMLKETI